jgi:carboxynorspermidine decarboxylase
METRAGDPGAFAHFDLNRVDSPAFVVDATKLRANLAILADIRDQAGIKMLAALKAFSMWSVAPIIGEYLDGVCTSGLWEARLASEFYDGEIATYSAAYKPDDLDEILRLSDHVIFNSPGQIIRCSSIIVRPERAEIRLISHCGSIPCMRKVKCRVMILARRIHASAFR